MASEERGLSEKGLGATVMKVVCSLCLQSRPQIISKFSYIVIILLNTHDCRLHSMSHKCRFRDVGLKRMDSFPQNV